MQYPAVKRSRGHLVGTGWLRVVLLLMTSTAVPVCAAGPVRLLTDPTTVSAGDIHLRFAAEGNVGSLVVFYGAADWRLAKFAPRDKDGFLLSLYDYGADELALRYYVEKSDGQGEHHDGPTLVVADGRADWGRDRYGSVGAPVGFNLIHALHDAEEAKMLRAVRELADLGVRDFLVNLYYLNYRNNLAGGAFDRLLNLTDELDCRVWFNTRQTEYWDHLPYHEVGLMAPELVEQTAFEFTTGNRHYLDGSAIDGDLNYALSMLTLPHGDERDVLAVEAFLYDPQALDPLPGARRLDEKEFSWQFEAREDAAAGTRRYRLTYRVESLPQLAGKVLSVLARVRSLRCYLVPPLWNDAYYEQFYIPQTVEPLVEHARLAAHPSFRGVAPINEPTLTWNGGEMFGPALRPRWASFLRERYRTVARLNEALERDYAAFDDVPYLPRLVYAGAYHTGWSGVPGAPGMNSEYEICKTRFREQIMNLVYQRSVAPYRRRFPNKDYFQKFQHAGPFSWYGLRMQQAHSAIELPELTVMASDIYPIGFKTDALPTPAQAASRFLAYGSYGVLLGRGAGKPAWVAETDFGRYRQHPAHTRAMATLMLDLLAAAGVERTFLWCVSPWADDGANGTNEETAYSPHRADYPDRITPGLLAQVGHMQRNADRQIMTPDYDIALLASPTDSMLHGAWDYHRSVEGYNDWCAAIIEQGLQAAQGPLTAATCVQARAVVVLGGFFLSDTEKQLLRALDRPVLILGHPFLANPVDGVSTAPGRRADDVFTETTTAIELADGVRVQVKAIAAIRAPGGAQVDAVWSGPDGTGRDVLFRVGRRTTFAAEPATPADAARLVRWWFERQRRGMAAPAAN